MPKISGNSDVAGDRILLRKLRLIDFNRLLAIDTLRLKIGLAFFGLMNVRLSVELVSAENGNLRGRKTSQSLAKFKALRNEESNRNRCFGPLFQALLVEPVYSRSLETRILSVEA
jgi:hypothetical protein